MYGAEIYTRKKHLEYLLLRWEDEIKIYETNSQIES